jgi:hypothetical protein
VADSSLAALEWLDQVAQVSRVSVITRLRLDAALYAPPPPRDPGQRRRPRLKGKRRPTLEAGLADENTPWSTLTIDDWYGEGRTRLQGEWSRVERFSVKPGKVRVTTLKEARDGIDQDAKGRLAQLATGLAQR